MATDSQDSHRKHSRSPSDDESPETSKLHKHRHRLHHHRRHHHRHHHKKHDDAKKDEIESGSKNGVKEGAVHVVVADYDMEEGEIIEDVPIGGGMKVDSDVESGEVRDFDYLITRGDADMVSPETNHSLPEVANGRSSNFLGGDIGDGDSRLPESTGNADFDLTFSKIESASYTRHKSPSRSSKHKSHHENKSKKQSLDSLEVDEDENLKHRNKLRENRHKALSRSPSNGRYDMETSDRSWSVSPERTRDRESSRRRHRHERDERVYDNDKVYDGLYDERDSRRSTDLRFGSRDIAKCRRERSSSLHRSGALGSKDEYSDFREEREEKLYYDKKRTTEKLRSREGSERDGDQDRILGKERNGSGGRDRARDYESDRDRGNLRDLKSDMDRYTGRDRERRRDKDRDWNRDRDLDRDKQRDTTITTYRDTEREWDDRLGDRDRKLEMKRGRDRYSSRDRHRERSRDDGRDRSRGYHKYDDRDDGYGSRDRHRGYDDLKYQSDRDSRYDLEKNRPPKDDFLMEDLDGVHRDDDDQKGYQDRVDIELAGQEEDDTEKIKEQSRRLREAILQKYKAQKSQNENVPQNAKESSEYKEEDTLKNVDMPTNVQEVNQHKRGDQDSGALETSFDLGKSPSNNSASVVNSTGAGGLGEGTPKSERSNDMFSDDIFGESPAGVRRTGKGDGLPVERSGLHDNWDDPEGYYSFRLGEILDSRYEITAAHGKGVFSTVVCAKDLKAGATDPEEVAIKIIRNNETMLKAGTEELVILKKLVGADQDNRRHCVQYLSHFKYRNHLCIVFESLHMNLREVLKKFGRNIGLKLTAVRAYAKQLFIALKHLRNCGVLHCDIKPDNMLVNDAKNVLKLCDFGNAMFAGKNEVTPYLVSRFYRAPEIILGLPYDHPMDIWSVGCCLYELYTGKVLFPGPTNNDMLRLHMELKGPFPKKMLRKGAFVEKHFDSNLNFLAVEEDPVTKKPIRRLIVNIKPKDVSIIIKGSPGEDPKMLANFKDLLDKFFALDPEKRLTVSQALNHPFITEWMMASLLLALFMLDGEG